MDAHPPGLGAAIRATRQRRGWNREALAFHAGLSYGAVAQIESGRRKDVRLASLLALADALEISIDALLGRRAERTLLEHRALPYGSDDELVDALVPFLEQGAARDEPLLAVVSAPNIELLREAAGPVAERIEFHDALDWYRSPSVALGSYRAYVDARVAEGNPWVRVIGEPVWHGRSHDETAAWTRYEAVINLVLSWAPATIVCPYDARTVPEQVVADCARTHPDLGGAMAHPSPAYDVENVLIDSALAT